MKPLDDHLPFLRAIDAAPDDPLPRLIYADYLYEQHEPEAAVEQRLVFPLRAVLDAPGDDVPRLRFADACEQHGWPERAEFIRVQCESERHPGPQYDFLRKRVAELYGKIHDGLGRKLMNELPKPVNRQKWNAFLNYGLRRGFVCGISCRSQNWLKHSATILASHPIEKVWFTDFEAAVLSIGRDGGEWSITFMHGPEPWTRFVYRSRKALIAEMPAHIREWVNLWRDD